jgi:hypothetical protein
VRNILCLAYACSSSLRQLISGQDYDAGRAYQRNMRLKNAAHSSPLFWSLKLTFRPLQTFTAADSALDCHCEVDNSAEHLPTHRLTCTHALVQGCSDCVGLGTQRWGRAARPDGGRSRLCCRLRLQVPERGPRRSCFLVRGTALAGAQRLLGPWFTSFHTWTVRFFSVSGWVCAVHRKMNAN